MQGGGTFSLQAGQFTDDSEMATHLINAMTYFNPHQILEKQ